MSIYLYPVCHRCRLDCEPISCISAPPDDATEDQIDNCDFRPVSFVCAGIIEPKDDIPQDCYRLCFKNESTDEMTDNDEQDITHIMAVLSQLMAVSATRKVNSGTISVPTKQG